MHFIFQEWTTGRWYEEVKVEQMVERRRAGRLLDKVKNDKWNTKAASPVEMIQELFHDGLLT